MKLMLPLIILMTLYSCAGLSRDELIQLAREVKKAYDEADREPLKQEKPRPTLEPSLKPISSPEPTIEPSLEPKNDDVVLPETNCKNPKKNLVSNGGTKCMASSTRGGSTVCLLDYSLSRPPYKTITDHHDQTFLASKNQNFDKVELVLRNNKRIKLSFAGQHNPVYLFDKKVAREHWRNTILWDKIKNRVIRLEAFYKGEKVCLKP